MKTADKRMEFIQLRAEGKSYRDIEAQAGISRSTCGKWEQELRAEISRLKQERLDEVYTAYGMQKEARIRRFGETLGKIDKAIEAADLSTIAPEKLLDLRLKYAAAIKGEHTPAAYAVRSGAAEDTLSAIIDLQNRVAAGETTPEQAKTEAALLNGIATAYTRAHPLDFNF